MKKALFIYAWLLMFISCQTEEGFSIAKNYPDKKVIITGLIKNYETATTGKFIRLGRNDFTKNAWDFSKARIADNGYFEFRFSIDRPQELLLQLTTTNATLLAFPSDSIFLELESNDFIQKQLHPKSISFSADRAETNTLIHHFLIAKHQDKESVLQTNVKNKSFKKYRLEKLKNDRENLEVFIEKQPIKDPVFEYWAKSYLKYKTAEDLLSYPRLKSDTTMVKKNPNYYTFLREFEVNNYNASISSNYGSFLHQYKKYIEERVVDQTKKKERIIKETIDSILAKTDGFAQDVLMTQYFYDKIESPSEKYLKPYYSVYYDSVSTKNFKRQFKRQHTILHGEGEIIIDDKTNLIIKKEVTNILPSIAERHKGKVVYVDMWGTWCVPCIQEMPMHKLLRERYKNKEVVFVYLAVNSKRNLWYKMIQNFEIEGDHFLLTKEQYDYLDRLFYIDGIPHHFLMNKDGKVAIDLVPGPSKGVGQQLNGKLITEINKLLN